MSHPLKIIISITVLMAIIISISVYSFRTLSSSSEKLDGEVALVEKCVKGGDWQKAESNLSSVKSQWDRTKKVWTMLLDHFEIDNIENTMSKLSKFIETRNMPLSLSETASLRQYIRHIPESQSFEIKNIL